MALDAAYLVGSQAGAALELAGKGILAAGPELLLADANGVVSKTRLLVPEPLGVVSKTRLLASDLAAGVVSKTRLLAPDGQVLAAAEGNIISNHSGSLISDQGGGLLSNHGSGLVAHGGGVVSKTRYALAQAEGRLGQGDLLPAAAVRVRLRSLRTGALLPIGQDEAGQAVQAIYTNLAGAYELHVPKEEVGNVLVEVGVPGVPDPRTQLSLMSQVGAAQEQALDEDTAMVTAMIREVFAGRLAAAFTEPPSSVACQLAQGGGLPPLVALAVQGMAEELHALGQEAGLTGRPEQAAEVAQLARRAAELVLASVDLPAIQVSAKGAEDAPPANTVGRPALELLVELMRESRGAASTMLAAQAQAFDALPEFQALQACAPGRHRILKGGDFNQFILNEFLTNSSDPGLLRAGAWFNRVGLPRVSEGGSSLVSSRLTRAMDAVLEVLVGAYLSSAHGEREALRAMVRAHPRGSFTPDAPASAPFLRPCQAGAPAACP